MGAQRYGNKAFAKWHEKLVEVGFFIKVTIFEYFLFLATESTCQQTFE
jgi:hypothetical protein